MFIHSLRMIDLWQCFFIIISVLLKFVVKDRGLYQQMIVACLLYFMESHMLAMLFSGMPT